MNELTRGVRPKVLEKASPPMDRELKDLFRMVVPGAAEDRTEYRLLDYGKNTKVNWMGNSSSSCSL